MSYRTRGDQLMATLSEKLNPAAIEQEVRTLWTAQGLPPPQEPIGPPEGRVAHQFLGAFAPQEAGTSSPNGRSPPTWMPVRWPSPVAVPGAS